MYANGDASQSTTNMLNCERLASQEERGYQARKHRKTVVDALKLAGQSKAEFLALPWVTEGRHMAGGAAHMESVQDDC